MRFPFETTIERGDAEIEIKGVYDVSPFVAATYWQPAEGGEVEIISVCAKSGEPLNLTEAEEDALFAELQERAPSDIAEEAACAADRRAEARRDDRLMGWED